MNFQLDYINKTLEVKKPSDFTVTSIFSGCGGSSTGYTWAGGKVLLAVEWDDRAVETYRLNYPETPVHHGDVCELTIEVILEQAGLQTGGLDILDGSPPCQGFSSMGKHRFDDKRNQLFHEYIRLLQGLRPKVFVMENVSGMIRGKMKMIFVECMRELKQSGYQVSCRLINAMYFGVPQSRQRLIFIGVRDDLGIKPSHPKPQTRPIPVRQALINVRQEPTPQLKGKYGGFWHKVGIGRSASDIIKKGQIGYNGCMKLDPNLPSRTLVKLNTGDGFATIVHWKEPRTISIPEAARLQSFPDCYQFAGTFQEQWAGIGNSVPPRFMQAIAEHIRDNILMKAVHADTGKGFGHEDGR